MSASPDNDTPETEAPMLQWRDIQALTQTTDSPCVSVYVPTTPVSNYREENRILYKDQVKQVGEVLEARDMDKYVRDSLMEQLESVGSNEVFWTHQQYGLAVFASPSRFLVRRMMTKPDSAQAIVADTFHLRPALRETANWMRYRVLCVSLHEVALYDGNQESIAEIPLHSDVPQSMVDATGKTDTGPSGDDSRQAGSDSDELKNYFREIDKQISKHHGGHGRPVVLCAVAEYQGLFREASDNADLLEDGLEHDPVEAQRESKLGELSWSIAQRAMRADIDQLIERYRERYAHNEGEADLEQVAYAATIGQVETLLIDQDARIEGSVDEDGKVQYGQSGDTHSDDVLDSIAEKVLATDGSVRFLPGDIMPTDSGVAAVLRFAMQPV